MLAGVLLGRPTVLLLDEPTNHLDLGGLRWLEGYLAAFPGGALVVSHDRRFLDNTVSRILELDGVSDELASYRAATRPTGPRSSAASSACWPTSERRTRIGAGSRRTSPGPSRRRSRWSGPSSAASGRRTSARSQSGGPQGEGPGAPPPAADAQAEWIADPSKAPSFTLSLDGVSTRGRRIAALDAVSWTSAAGPSFATST